MLENTKIEVRPLPNGHSLRFEGMYPKGGFMYFSNVELLKGFMVHIGLEVTGQLSMEEIDGFIEAAIRWRDNKECVEEIERQKEELRHLTNKRNIIAKRLVDERQYNLNLVEEIRSNLVNVKNILPEKVYNTLLTIIRTNKKPIILKSLGVSGDAIIDDSEDYEEDDE